VQDYKIAITEQMDWPPFVPTRPFPGYFLQVPEKPFSSLPYARSVLDIILRNIFLNQRSVFTMKTFPHKAHRSPLIFSQVRSLARVIWIANHFGLSSLPNSKRVNIGCQSSYDLLLK
jgi:hypothetical protein